MSRPAIAGVALCAALLLAPTGSSACGCGPISGVVVAHGTSPNGAPWLIKADEQTETSYLPRSVIFEFISGDPAELNGFGYSSLLTLPIPRAFVFNATSGDGVYPEKEGDVSGIARARARLAAKMSDGSAIEIETQRPPAKLRQHFPWLRGLVFFEQFYPADIEPLAITAYGRDGHVLYHQSL